MQWEYKFGTTFFVFILCLFLEIGYIYAIVDKSNQDTIIMCISGIVFTAVPFIASIILLIKMWIKKTNKLIFPINGSMDVNKLKDEKDSKRLS